MAGFSWAAAADVAGGIGSAISAWGTASANRIVRKANAEAEEVVRGAQNTQRAANLSLAATMRTQAYRATLTNAGEAFNGAGEMIARTQEAFTRHNFEQGLKGLEQTGGFAARAAAAGVGGASIRAVSYSVSLQQQRFMERELERQDETMYEMVKQRTGIMPAAISRLDVSPLTANLDHTPTFQPTGSDAGDLLGALVQGFSGKTKSLQVMLDSIGTGDERPAQQVAPTTGDFSRMDRAWFPEAQVSSIRID